MVLIGVSKNGAGVVENTAIALGLYRNQEAEERNHKRFGDVADFSFGFAHIFTSPSGERTLISYFCPPDALLVVSWKHPTYSGEEFLSMVLSEISLQHARK